VVLGLGVAALRQRFQGLPDMFDPISGHTEAYAMLQDALWFALSLVWLCPLAAAIIFVFSH
jgi:hypothetical protein